MHSREYGIRYFWVTYSEISIWFQINLKKMGFPSFAYSLIAPSTGCRLFATEHSSNQFRLQAVFHSKTDDSKIHVVFVLEICKELLSGRQTFQAFASFYCRQTLTVSRTIIFLCQYKGTDSVLSRI